MPKIIGFAFMAVLIGSSVVAWSRSTATGPHEAQHAARVQAFDPNAMHRALAGPLPEQRVHDMSLVYSDER
jgi:hypothetical protein